MPDVAAVARRTGLLWVGPASGPVERSTPVWHLWQDGSSYVVIGPGEQDCPALRGPPASVLVTARGKGGGDRVLTWLAAVDVVAPGSAGWVAAVPMLAAARLNAPDPVGLPDRWAATAVVLRLTPLP